LELCIPYTQIHKHTHTHTLRIRCIFALSDLFVHLAVYAFLFASCGVVSVRLSCGVCVPRCISCCLFFSRVLRCMFSSLYLVLSGLRVHLAEYVFLFASRLVCSSRASCGVCFPLCIICCLVVSSILRCMFSSLWFGIWYGTWYGIWYGI